MNLTVYRFSSDSSINLLVFELEHWLVKNLWQYALA